MTNKAVEKDKQVFYLLFLPLQTAMTSTAPLPPANQKKKHAQTPKTSWSELLQAVREEALLKKSATVILCYISLLYRRYGSCTALLYEFCMAVWLHTISSYVCAGISTTLGNCCLELHASRECFFFGFLLPLSCSTAPASGVFIFKIIHSLSTILHSTTKTKTFSF